MKIFVKAKPGSRREELRKVDDTHFIVSVKAPAKDGKANKEIEKAVAGHFNLPLSRVRIVKGFSSKQKVIAIL